MALLVLAALAATRPAGARQVLPKLGGETRINERTKGSQVTPAIAADADGNFAVAWLGPDDLERTRVHVRLFSAAGQPLSLETEIDTPGLPTQRPHDPRVSMTPNGRFVVLWSDQQVKVRLFDPAGQPLGPELQANDLPLATDEAADVAMAANGRFLVTWLSPGNPDSIYARRFEFDGSALEAGQRISLGTIGTNRSPRAVALPPFGVGFGSFGVVWVRQRIQDFFVHDDDLMLASRPEGSGRWSTAAVVNTQKDRLLSTPYPVAYPGGELALVWTSVALHLPPAGDEPPELRALRLVETIPFDVPEIRPLGTEAVLALPVNILGAPIAASDPAGNTLVLAAQTTPGKPQGRLFDRSWKPVGDPIPVVTYEADQQREPALTSALGGFVAAWQSGFDTPIFPTPPHGQDGDAFGIFAQRFAPPLCTEGSRVLCLGDDGRFELTIDWKTPQGHTGSGRALPLSVDTGAFSFFAAANLELMVKVLDGRAVNGHFWVFSGALSDVDYTLAVVDSRTGERRSYPNPQGQLVSRADTEAFAADPGLVALAAAHRGRAAGVTGMAEVTEAAALTTASCQVIDSSALCFPLAHLFRVSVDFVDPRTGLHGIARALHLTDNTGAFSFFYPGNLELMVKVLDGRAINGKFWVFYGGLSDVGYTITVEDLTAQTTRTYTNPHGRLESRADTQAFGS